jgi:mono/diheme cytochrome c family protein
VRKYSLAVLVAAVASFLSVPAVRAGSLDEAAKEGARAFADTGLGSNGKSCSTCHGDGTAFAGRTAFPKEALGGVRTLDQAIQVCLTNALGGKALPWDDRRLSGLAVFLARIYSGPSR